MTTKDRQAFADVYTEHFAKKFKEQVAIIRGYLEREFPQDQILWDAIFDHQVCRFQIIGKGGVGIVCFQQAFFDNIGASLGQWLCENNLAGLIAPKTKTVVVDKNRGIGTDENLLRRMSINPKL